MSLMDYREMVRRKIDKMVSSILSDCGFVEYWFELRVLSLDVLKDNEIQPPYRAEMIRDLIGKIKRCGTILPPVVCKCGDKYIVLDGHRRITVAEYFGLKAIQILVITLGKLSNDPSLGLACLNQGRRNWIGKTWFYTWAVCEAGKRDELELPVDVRRDIYRIVDLVGMRHAVSYGKRYVSPHAIAQARFFISVLKQCRGEKEKDINFELPTERSVFEFMVERGAQKTLNEWVRNFRDGSHTKSASLKIVKNAIDVIGRLGEFEEISSYHPKR